VMELIGVAPGVACRTQRFAVAAAMRPALRFGDWLTTLVECREVFSAKHLGNPNRPEAGVK